MPERVMVDGCIDVIVEGEGDAVVLLPSSQRGSDDFDVVAARIAAAGHRVLRPQPRGIGASSGSLDGLTLHALAADVAATVRTLGGGRAVVVGHAYGHYVARVTDRNYPELVRGVVMAAAASAVIDPALPAALDCAADAAMPEIVRLAALRLAFFAPGRDPHAWLDGWYPALAGAYRSAAQVPPRSIWSATANAPVLDLQAAQDPWRPPASRSEVTDALGCKASVVLVPNASHALFPEQPAAVADAIIGWIAGLPR
ncbi:alpha/beta fold hydrolase [Duganella aceris]|uniref:Alpha/beta hydrolase n=1 Tax=Duganella aceris TaxID=2703883 RepID=A0ABX0FL20_9BURK|nr:alpha/beta hydrolase [Duganella aceris]NGZ85208.1 alpha/beta hydrolase [Duganella aceris]